jgi:hypothetical protein
MVYITIDGNRVSLINDMSISEVTTIAKEDFNNYDEELLNNEIWNKDAKEIEYIVSVSHAQLWILYQKYLKHTIITVGDPTYGKSIMSFITYISENYNFNNFETPWTVTLTIISIKEIDYQDGDYLGFEYDYDEEDGEAIGFEKTEDDTVGFERTYI